MQSKNRVKAFYGLEHYNLLDQPKAKSTNKLPYMWQFKDKNILKPPFNSSFNLKALTDSILDECGRSIL